MAVSNELKVTGGEWRAERIGDDWMILNDSHECVETVYTGEANAHLLAASKKLYEALIQARESLAEGLETPGFAEAPGSESDRVLIAEIDAALAAARGEAQ